MITPEQYEQIRREDILSIYHAIGVDIRLPSEKAKIPIPELDDDR